jgi:hypothetical protein
MTMIRHNLRGLGMVLTAALLVASVAPLGVWRCLDGTVCPMGGAMLHSSAQRAKQAKSDPHSCCRPSISPMKTGAAFAASGMRCILSHAGHPSASLTRAPLLQIVPDSNAILTPAARVVNSVERSPELIVLSSDLPPPPDLVSLPGRSPPTQTS